MKTIKYKVYAINVILIARVTRDIQEVGKGLLLSYRHENRNKDFCRNKKGKWDCRTIILNCFLFRCQMQ